jgi:hypothetical protein
LLPTLNKGPTIASVVTVAEIAAIAYNGEKECGSPKKLYSPPTMR